MPIDLNVIRANPKFAAMSYDEQQAITKRALQLKIQETPEMGQFSPQEQELIASKASESYAPVLREGKNAVLTDADRMRFSASLAPTTEANDETKYVLWLAEQSRAGNEQAMDRGAAWITTRRLTNETLIGKIAAAGKDAYEAIRYADRDWDLGFDADTTKKLASYLATSMGARGARVQSAVSIAAPLAGMLENVALNLVFVGSLATPGLLTKGLFASAAKGAATAAPGIAHLAAKGFASYGVEALGSASIDVLRSLPQIIQTGAVEGSGAFWKKTAGTFGEGIAFDVLFNVAQDVVRATLLPAAKIFFGRPLNLGKAGAIDELQKAVKSADAPTAIRLMQSVMNGKPIESDLATLDPDVAKSVRDATARMRMLEKLDPKAHDSDDFLTLYGKASGYDVEPLKTGYLIKRDGQTITSAASRPDAFSWLGANPKLTIDEFDLKAPYRGQDTAKFVTALRGKVDPSKLSDDTLIGMTVATKDGVTDAKTVRLGLQTMLKRADPTLTDESLGAMRTVTISEAGFRKRIGNIPKLLTDHPDSIVVPKTMGDPTTREAFLNYLTAFGRTKSKDFRNVAVEYAERSAVSPLGLTTAAAKLPEGSMLQDGNAWRLSYRDATGQMVTRVAQSNEEAGALLGRSFVETGLLNEDEIARNVYRETGVSITPESSEFGTTVYSARGADGSLIARGSSMQDIFQQRPSLWPRLPDRLGPDLYYLGDGNRFELRQTIATGPYSEIQRTMNNFGPTQVPASWKVLEQIDDKKVRIKAPVGSRVTSRYAVEIDGLGYQTEFTTLKKAREFVSTELDGWEGVRRVANERGYDLQAGPRGTTLISSIEGNTNSVAKNLDEAKQILAASPITESHKNLFTLLGDEIDDTIVRGARETLETDTTAVTRSVTKVLDENAKRFNGDTIKNFLTNRFSPAYSALEQMAKRSGLPEIAEKARKINASTRMMGAATLKAQRVIRAIASPQGKLLKRSENEVLGRILSEGPENWDSAAKSLGLDLTSQLRSVLSTSKAYFDRLGQEFGIDPWRYLTEYAPKIRAAVADFRLSSDMTKLTKHQLLSATFGSKWREIPEVSFFAKHNRLDNFLDVTRNQMGIIEQMSNYTEQGYKEKYLGAIQEKMADWYKKLESYNLDSATQNRIAGFYNDVLGGGLNDPLSNMMKETSIALTTKLADGVRALGGVFPKSFQAAFGRAADKLITSDIGGKASAMVTHATLGFRPFRGIANLGQYMNTYSVFGDDAIKAMNEVTDSEVELLFKKGVIQEKVFATSAEGINESNKLLEWGLKPQQQSEYLTRAWTASAAGKSFDSALIRLANKTTNWEQFVKESRINLLDATGIDEVLRLTREGQSNAARTMFQTEAVRTLMFDYAKENYPMAFKGVVGRAFGKFGIYPVGQVDLYRRILTSGDPLDRVVRATRMIAASVLIYNAFRQVGVDYSGFLWNDAFSFGGGPMFQAGLSVMNIADQGPTGAMARRDLARSFLPGLDSDGNFTLPRLVVPGALEVNALIKASRMVENDPYRAALTALGATTTKDWLRGGLTVW